MFLLANVQLVVLVRTCPRGKKICVSQERKVRHAHHRTQPSFQFLKLFAPDLNRHHLWSSALVAFLSAPLARLQSLLCILFS